jgi:peroxiredoxin
MELEALQEIHPEVRALGAEMVVITPELERYTRALHKKLNLTFHILTDLHLKIAEQFHLVFTLPDYLRDLYKSFGSTFGQIQRRAGLPLTDPIAICSR